MTILFYVLIVISVATGQRYEVGNYPNLDDCRGAAGRWYDQAENKEILTECEPLKIYDHGD